MGLLPHLCLQLTFPLLISGDASLRDLEAGLCDPAVPMCTKLPQAGVALWPAFRRDNCTCPPDQQSARKAHYFTMRVNSTGSGPDNAARIWVRAAPCDPGAGHKCMATKPQLCSSMYSDAKSGWETFENRTRLLEASDSPGWVVSLLPGGVTALRIFVRTADSSGNCNSPDKWPMYTINVSSPQVVDPRDEPTLNWLLGALLCEISAALYACGICLQRYALNVAAEPKVPRAAVGCMSGAEPRESAAKAERADFSMNRDAASPGQFSGCARRNRADLLWGCGFGLWGAGNSVYAVGLTYVPLSLMTSLFATVLIFNGILATVFLGEEVRKSDLLSWLLIFIGISLCGIFLAKEKDPNCCTAEKLFHMAARPLALIFQISIALIIVCLTSAIVWYERQRASGRVDGPYPLLIVIAYPVLVAQFESLIQIFLDGLMSMWHQTTIGNSQLEDPRFYLVGLLLLLGSLAVMFWMRRAYARFEAVTVLPIQMGVLIGCTVLGGLMFYDEYLLGGMTFLDLCMTFLGVSFIVVGITIGARAKFANAIAKRAAAVGLHSSLMNGTEGIPDSIR